MNRQEPWDVQLNKDIPKRLARHGRRVNRRLKEALERLKLDPHHGKSLKGYENVYSLAVGTPSGEFRIIYRLRYEDHVILVDLIEPRQEVYKLLKRRA
ncbi:MAG: type II toxin-antitoxin system RelE/ParE family toxin [Nitrospinota bacterium]